MMARRRRGPAAWRRREPTAASAVEAAAAEMMGRRARDAMVILLIGADDREVRLSGVVDGGLGLILSSRRPGRENWTETVAAASEAV
jgi:hypothetical protein